MHTPGPWGIEGTANIGYAIVHSGPILNVVADNVRREANARLIAAAPDLLEACKHSLAILASVKHEFIEELLLVEIRAAIAKGEA